MICKFCGQNNSDDAAFCSRCGSPLKENRHAAPAAPATPAASDVDDDKKTMRMQSRPDEAGAGNGVMMHDCGYPLLPGMQVCPKCHRPVAVEPAPTIPDDDGKKTVVISNPGQQPQHSGPRAPERAPMSGQGGSSAKKTERFVAPDQNGLDDKRTEPFIKPGQQYAEPKSTEPSIAPGRPSTPYSAKKTERFVPSDYSGGSVNKRTVNIHNMQKPVEHKEEPAAVPHCSLKALAREGETTAVPPKRDYLAEKVVLNRDNTEPGNYSITSQQQAVLTFENGKWYIEDRSAYKTTYIRVTKRTELHEGDIVGLGDREFKFSVE